MYRISSAISSTCRIFRAPASCFAISRRCCVPHFDATLDAMDGLFSEPEWQQIDALAGIESRGFILAAGLAAPAPQGLRADPQAGQIAAAGGLSRLCARIRQRVLEMQRGWRAGWR